MSARTSADTIRLNRFLAQVGVASRRACDEIVAAGRVRVDGTVVKEPGMRINPGVHTVTLDGQPLDRPRRPLVLLLHKPTGVVSTVSDPQGRPTVIDLCARYARGKRLFPVGRLDVNTTGALLVTNDGLLCYRLTHPSFEVPRTYVARVRGGLTRRGLELMRKLARPEGKNSTPEQLRARGRRRPGVDVVKELGKITVIRVTLAEGRNRQVRRLCEAAGLHIIRLKRVSYGPISVRGLPLGSVRPLERNELAKLRRIVGADTGETGRGDGGHRETR